ncbi:AraC family transcriptional regulator [Pedobacter sp. MC2016-24]|uniref:AraC family transcriptional regulator n=1 Tax=Pedobacter sp. MC2016-24 TaxID=2780090 RepID=UPI00187E56E2|nr:AraC family transcriptional regulator [Pedobacter sp. MC2016-24]MBE9602320.1 helix-turn-helix domain-containing protein [Pedobacter sp. MC2016-24]
MRKEMLYQNYEVIYQKVDECPVKDLQLTFFQLVSVISGSGALHINGNQMPYQAGNLMLLTPADAHFFEISTTSEFLLVKFNSNYVNDYQWQSIDHIECLLHYSSHLSGCILKCRADEFLVKGITASLLHCLNHKDMYQEDLSRHYMNALIVIAARNLAKMRPPGLHKSSDKRIIEIINYIQLNICFPQKIKAPVIATRFGLSDTYLGSYFKHQCGETLQQFITNYKIRLIEFRLKFSDKRVHEIADEFGFSDESHLNKFFKKQKEVSLTVYRMQYRMD